MIAIRLLNHLANPTLYQVRAEAPKPVTHANITFYSSSPTPPSSDGKRAA